MTQIASAFHRRHERNWTLTALLVGSALVAGCGGGGGYGGGGGSMPPPPPMTLTVAPTTITLGQTATLTWTSTGGNNCTASGGWSGAQTSNGSAPVTPTAAGTVTYTLTCDGSGAYGGSSSKSATLTVNAATAYSATALVGDTAGAALTTDANLVNPWGIAFTPTSFAWVANNHSETSTLYDGDGIAQPVAAPLIVNLPPSGAVTFDPTGIVYNPTSTDFVVTAGAVSAGASFIFTGEGGMIGGWSRGVDATHVVVTYTDAGGAVYKGLAIGSNGTSNFLYVTDFHNGKIDVFNSSFVKQPTSATSFSFADPTLPAGYAPFGILALNNGPGGATQLYVSYAQQMPPDNHDNANGAGLGLVNIFDSNGTLVKHLVPTGGALNAPWGMALAPADFGTLSGALLVGNFGDGKINAFDASSGAVVGTVADSTGAAFAAPGLWGIAFGNDAHNQPHNTLFYAAGLNNEANGVYGRIDLGAAPVLDAKPVVTLTAPTATGLTFGTTTVSADATDALGISKVEFFAGATSIGSVTTSPYSIQWNTTTIADGVYQVTAVATDPDNRSTTSAATTVTVQNTPSTLTFLQTTVFTPHCSGCHNGVGSTLPGVQNLTTGNTFASVVGVASMEEPTLMRVKPGDPANSYLIQKIEGAAGISGVRMPAGGPYLDQVTIDQVKSWIAAGALNN